MSHTLSGHQARLLLTNPHLYGNLYKKKTTKRRSSYMDKYKCIPCGYIYDPAVGDADGGIAPGTPFEDIPEDWACPVCYVSKDEFEKI